MTVQELMDVSPFCELVEVVVRKNGCGQWIQGYRIGKDAKIYPSEITAEVRELKGLKKYRNSTLTLEDDEEIDLIHGLDLPMKVICKDCHKLPKNIGNLEVCYLQPRHVTSFHGEALIHNDFSFDITCYPENYVPEIEEKTEIDGQMDIFAYIGG